MFNKKQSIKNNQKDVKTASKLWESVSEDNQIDIKGGASVSLLPGDTIAYASAWPPKFPPYF